jgi:CheY-like chemotaxis protein
LKRPPVLNSNTTKVNMTTAQHTRHDAAPFSHIRPIYHRALAPRVLVVAKDERFRRWARGRLRESGFEILVADDGFDASKAVDRDPPELIVVDHAVPWFGVICLLDRVRRDTTLATIPVLLVAQSATESFANVCRALGIAVLVRRPGEPKAVLHVPVPEPRMTQRGDVAGIRDPSRERSP